MKTLNLSGKSGCFGLKTVLLPLCMLAVMMLATQVMAATITVDSYDGTPGTCTLPDAITAANTDTLTGGCAAGSGDDTITFAAGLAGKTIPLTSELYLNSNITFDGSGLSSNVKISGNNAYRVFYIYLGRTVVLKNLDIINGKNGGGNGGGIENAGTLTVSNSTFSGNSASFGDGGGIYNGGTGTLTVSNSIFSGNTATYGGGIYNDGTLTVSNSTFSGNTTDGGGGILNAGTLTVSNSTFSGNTASSGGDGGGIYNGGTGTLTVSNSIFSGNSTDYGGGISNQGTLTVSNSTFSGNSAGGGGGGIKNVGTLTFRNTILANSTSGGDCVNSGTVSSAVNNLIEDSADVCGLTNGVNGNIIGSDPLLSALADNGGSTQTMALQAGSPAINAGNPATCIATDQRGYARVGTCDIGAFEYGAVLPAPSLLNAAAVSQTQIDLSWTDNSSDETGFKIYRGATLVTTTAADATSYNDTGLTCNTAYTYTVKATNAGGDSAATTSASATTAACFVPITAGVTLTGISSITGSTVLATGNATGAGIGERGFYWWIPPTTETHFGGSESGLIPEGNGAGSFSLNITGLRPGNTYHIKAYVKVGGQIISSDEQLFTTATTGATGKMAPTVLTDTANYTVSGNSITVSGEITDIGSTPVNVYGFVYAPHSAPFTGDDMPKTGDRAYAMWDRTPLYQGMKFTGTIRNIPPGKWYLRAYAHNTNPDSSASQPESLSYGEEISFTIACTPETCIPGDVNGDGSVDLADAMLVLRILSGIPVANINLNADVNGDGKIGHEELGYILHKVSGLR